MESFIYQLNMMFNKHADEIFQYCYCCLGNRKLAIEITEETFVKAFKFLKCGQAPEEVEMRLRTIAHRLLAKERLYRVNKQALLKGSVSRYT